MELFCIKRYSPPIWVSTNIGEKVMSKSIVFNPRNCDNGVEFEAYVVDFLNKFELNAQRTKGDDGGVDVIATYSQNNVNYNFYIQCKFQNRIQGKEPIQEIYAGMHFRNDKNGHPVVITNNNFSIEAQKYARRLGVELIGKGEIGLIGFANSDKIYTYNVGPLLSIILYTITGDKNFKKNIIFRDLPCENVEQLEKDSLKEQILKEFETAKDLVMEYELLQMKASAKLKEAIEVKKNAIVHGIEYG